MTDTSYKKKKKEQEKKNKTDAKAEKNDTDLKSLLKWLYPVFFAGQVSSCVAALSGQI